MPKSKERRMSCPYGKSFKNKRDAEKASSKGEAYVCHRCRGWHPKEK